MAKTEEIVSHFGLVRLRLNGSGNLKLKLWSLDQVKSSTLVPLIMASSTNVEPTRLCNFTQQRAQLEIRTIGIDQTFKISKVIIFTKPVATSYPG